MCYDFFKGNLLSTITALLSIAQSWTLILSTKKFRIRSKHMNDDDDVANDARKHN